MTEKFFDFNLQLFALSDVTPTIGASESEITIEGSDTEIGEAPIETADTITVATIEAELAPQVDDTQELDGITYTYDGENWTFETETTETAASEIVDQIISENYSPAEGDTQEIDGVTYTYDGSDWTFETETTETATSEIVDQIISENYSPAEGDTQEIDGVTYTYTDGSWTYATDTTETAASDTVLQIIEENYAPQEGDTQEIDGVTYTYDGENWNYETTTTETATSEIAEQIISENYAPQEGDTQDYNGVTYTYTDGSWTFENTTTETATADIISEIIAENYSPAEGDTQDYNGVTYTYTDGSWTFENTTTETATSEIAEQIISENYSPAEGDTQDYNGVTYTYTDGSWTFENTTTETATADIISEIIAENYSPAEGDTQDYNGTTYTYDGSNWTYEVGGDIADSETLAQIEEENYTPKNGDQQTYSGITYTYTDGSWTYLDENSETAVAPSDIAAAIVTAFYSPNDGDEAEIDGVTYTYDGSNWVSASFTEFATSEIAAAIVEAYYLPSEGDSQTASDGITYTYTDGAWSYETTTTETAATEIAAAIVEENYLPSEGDTAEIEGVTYTFDGSGWSYETTTTETAASEIAAAIVEENYLPSEGDTAEIDGVTYTYDGSGWLCDTETTETAAAELVDQIVEEYYSPAADDTAEIEGVTYTYDGSGWTFETETTETATSEIVDQIVAEYYSPAEGDVAEIEGVTYTYDGSDWTFETDTTEAATAEIASAIVAEYYSYDTGETVEIDGVTYTFEGDGVWTYEGEAATVTSYYQFSGSESSNDAPVSIQTAETEGTELENTAIASPAYVSGNGEDIAIDGVGTISGLDETETMVFTASEGAVEISEFVGEVELTTARKDTQLKINGAALDFTAEKGSVIEISGLEESVALSGEAVTVNAIDDKQAWLVDEDSSVNFGKVEYSAVDEILLSGAESGEYLNAYIEDGETLAVTKGGSGRVDTLAVNDDAIITGLGRTGGLVSVDDEEILVTAAEDGTIGSGDTAANLAAEGTATILAGDIIGVDKLAANGKATIDAGIFQLDEQGWIFGSKTTLTADSDGTEAAKIDFASGGATLASADDDSDAFGFGEVSVNGKASWSGIVGDDEESAMIFDADGNATLSGTGDATSTIELRSGKKVTLTSAPTEDVLELSKGDVVVVSEDEAVMANSIAAGGSWSVAAETAVLGDATLTTEKNHLGYNAVITAGSKGDVIDEIADINGTATLSYTSDTEIKGMMVGDNFWTIKNDSDNEVYFDESGNVTVSAGTGDNILDVTGTTDAAVHVVSENVAVYNINGSTIMSYGDTEVDYTLETNGQHAGIAAISGVDDDVTFTVDGDGAYKLNDFTFANSARYDAAFRVIDEDEIDLYGVRDKDNITLTGGIAEFNLTGATEDSAKVTLNGVGVTLKGEALSDTKILAVGNDIEAFGGVKFGNEITTSGDETFTIAYDASEVVDSASYVIAINDTKVSLEGDNVNADEVSVEVTSDGTLKIKGLALGTGDTLTVTGGTYKLGNSAAVTVNESIGYITFDSYGNATAEDESAAASRKIREAIDEAIAASEDTSVAAYELYANLGKEDSGAPNSTVAGYEDAADTSPVTHTVTDGINIYGNAALNSEDLQYVTLTSSADDPIVLTNESSKIKTSVIDVQNSQNQLVAIVPNSISAVNHSVLGSDAGGNIVFGANARGNNYVKSGSGNTYLSNEGGDATLLGGAGDDSILAGDGDYVQGGAGADYFFDANGSYVVRDYSVSDGDVIVASALSDINKNLDAKSLVEQIDADGNSIAIAGGNRITLESASTSSDATVSGLNVIFTDATADDTHKLTWAPQTGGTVTADAFSEGAVLMVSDNNGGRADSVVGSGDNDTIFVGGNDTVKPGAGKDEIYVTADSSKRQDGATIVLGDGGRDYIHGWSFGFDSAAGNNVLNADVDALKYDVKGDTLLAYDSKDTVYFVDNASDTAFDLLVGTPEDATKVTVIKSGNNVITSEDDIADRYYAAPDINATLTFAASVGDIGDTINLGTSKEQNIHSVVLANEGTATLVGSDEKDVVVLSGSANADARKYVSLGGGNDSIVSGGTETSVTGNSFYFGMGNDGTDVIDNFGYYQGAAADADKDGADMIVLYNWEEGKSSITANANNIEIAVNDSSKLNISGAVDPNNKIVYRLGADGEERILQMGQTSGKKNNFVYDEETFAYQGNTSSEKPADTLSVASTDDNVEIWLDNSKGTHFRGIGVIDASASTGTQLTLVGGGFVDNTIIGGGAGNSSSLWGGTFSNNELIGGDGDDTFFFFKGSSNDTISGYDSANDRIRLADITLDDLLDAKTFFDGDNIKIATKAESGGGTLTIKDAASGTQVEVSDGNGGYHSYTATKSGSDWSWQG